jgi:spore germination cell wall hydrolase CwlJ-like protein
LTHDTAARADARALTAGLAIGAAVGLVLGGAYVGGGLAQTADARAKAVRVASAAPAQARQISIGATASDVTSVAGRPLVLTRISATPARPFRFPAGVMLNSGRDLDCLADAVYYEARGETPAGQAAIAQVVLNRVRHPAFPKSVCGVVFQGADTGDNCQFSFACDGAMRRPKDGAAWARAEQIAARAMAGFVMPQVGQATHFHAAGVEPGWGPSLMRVAQVGLHVFYRFGGHAGAASSFDREAQPSAPAADAPRTVFASMLPGLGGDARPAASPAAATAAPAPSAPPAATPAAPADKARPDVDTAAAAKPVASVS